MDVGNPTRADNQAAYAHLGITVTEITAAWTFAQRVWAEGEERRGIVPL